MTWSLPRQSSFTFGKRSEAELSGSIEKPKHGDEVHPKLQAVTRLALAISACDFGIHDGLRTEEEHAENVAAGTSRARRSKHIDGLAVDAVPWVDGSWTWFPLHCFRVAYAHQLAARFLRIPIIWGGAWDRHMNELGHPKVEHQLYIERYKRANRDQEPLIDLVHFELVVP